MRRGTYFEKIAFENPYVEFGFKLLLFHSTKCCRNYLLPRVVTLLPKSSRGWNILQVLCQWPLTSTNYSSPLMVMNHKNLKEKLVSTLLMGVSLIRKCDNVIKLTIILNRVTSEEYSMGLRAIPSPSDNRWFIEAKTKIVLKVKAS